jgi:hypothetical protein
VSVTAKRPVRTLLRWLTVAYAPEPEDRAFLERAQSRSEDGLEVSVAVLSDHESRRFFGLGMARRHIQPVWLRIVNRRPDALRLDRVKIDPRYYTPLEAARICHFGAGKQLVGFGLLSWLYLPFLPLVLLRFLSGRKANRRIDALFKDEGLSSRPILPDTELEGFVFTTLDEGSKQVTVRLLGEVRAHELEFSLEVPGLDVTDDTDDAEAPSAQDGSRNLTEADFRSWLQQQPRSTANKQGSTEGDPLNLVVVGDRAQILACFGARWDPAESITLATSWKTFKAFLLESEYRYSPVSPLYLDHRQQDFALQRTRRQINERLHLRLWHTGVRFEGRPVWIGQISRDIGVRFTTKTWNLTTHKIDPDVDEARDYVLDDLLATERVAIAGYVAGVGEALPAAPRRNLTGDPFYTDGLRAVAVLSSQRVQPSYLTG